jgi:hypothetical protein
MILDRQILRDFRGGQPLVAKFKQVNDEFTGPQANVEGRRPSRFPSLIFGL